MNTVNLIGRTTKEIELKYTNSGKAVTQFSLAVNRGIKDEQGNTISDFINCVAWGGTAELLSQYVQKGNRIGVVGRIQVRKYIDKYNVTKYITEVVISSIDLLENKKQNDGTNSINDFNTSDFSIENDISTIEIDDSNLPF